VGQTTQHCSQIVVVVQFVMTKLVAQIVGEGLKRKQLENVAQKLVAGYTKGASMTESDFITIENYVREATGQKLRNVVPTRALPSLMHIHLSKKERKGKTPQQQLALRREKYVNAGGKEQV